MMKHLIIVIVICIVFYANTAQAKLSSTPKKGHKGAPCPPLPQPGDSSNNAALALSGTALASVLISGMVAFTL